MSAMSGFAHCHSELHTGPQIWNGSKHVQAAIHESRSRNVSDCKCSLRGFEDCCWPL